MFSCLKKKVLYNLERITETKSKHDILSVFKTIDYTAKSIFQERLLA